MKKTAAIVWILFFALTQSCRIYSFSGASIPDDMKTVSVKFFENNASLVIPYLSEQFTNALENRIRSQSRLNLVRTDEDASFEGQITDYTVRPTAIQGNDQSTSDRLTITIQVNYKNNLKPELSFKQSFSRFKDFSVVTQTLQAQEQDLINDINRQLTEDIFNRAFANW